MVASPNPATEVTGATVLAFGVVLDRVVLDLSADPIDLTVALVDIPSVSRDETRIADGDLPTTRCR